MNFILCMRERERESRRKVDIVYILLMKEKKRE